MHINIAAKNASAEESQTLKTEYFQAFAPNKPVSFHLRREEQPTGLGSKLEELNFLQISKTLTVQKGGGHLTGREQTAPANYKRRRKHQNKCCRHEVQMFFTLNVTDRLCSNPHPPTTPAPHPPPSLSPRQCQRTRVA